MPASTSGWRRAWEQIAEVLVESHVGSYAAGEFAAPAAEDLCQHLVAAARLGRDDDI
jgi:hypothetical protein